MKIGRAFSFLSSDITVDADIDMNSHKLTEVSAGSENGHSVRREQVVGVFLPLAGGTMTGTLALGAQKLTTTNHLFKELDAAYLVLKNIGDTAESRLQLKTISVSAVMTGSRAALDIDALDSDNAHIDINVRDTGVGKVEVASFIGAADPYMKVTLPMVLNPSTYPGTPIEGHFFYESTSDKLAYKNATVKRIVWGNYTKASETLRNSNDTEKQTLAAAYTKIKEIALNEDIPACRLKFDLKSATGTTVYARVYKDSVAIGTEQSRTPSTYETMSEDFTGWVKDELIQIYAHSDGEAGRYAIVQNMRLYYDVDLEAISATNQDPV